MTPVKVLAFFLVAWNLVSGDDDLNCRCSVVIVGDNQIFVTYESTTLAHAHDCDDVDGCKQKCEKQMIEQSNGGDLNAKPQELKGMSIGDFGCQLIGLDIDQGVVSVYSRVCQHQSVKTDFSFKKHLCCRNNVHKDDCP